MTSFMRSLQTFPLFYSLVLNLPLVRVHMHVCSCACGAYVHIEAHTCTVQRTTLGIVLLFSRHCQPLLRHGLSTGLELDK